MPETRTKNRARSTRRAAKAPDAAPPRKSGLPWWVYTAVAAAALIVTFQVYAPALNAPYVFDDTSLPYYSPHFPDALPAWVTGVRPLLMFSYWLNYIGSKEPAGFHLVNLFLHLLNALFVFVIVRSLLSRTQPAGAGASPLLLAGFAAGVFLLHPIQTESVSYIAGRSESLSALFFLAAFLLYLYRGLPAASWSVAFAILLLFAAAAASKEHTIVLPGLLLLTDYYWNPGFSFSGIRRNWRTYLLLALSAVAGAAVVAKFVLARSFSAGFGMRDLTWYQYFFTECRAFFTYLRLLVLPVDQNLDWDYTISRTVLDHGTILAIAALLLLAAAAIYFRNREPLASYGFLVFILLLSPTSSFVPIKDPLVERRLYLPMVGVLLLAVALVRRVRIDRRQLAGVLACVLAALAYATYQRNQLWANDLALWEDTARKSPNKARVHFQLAHTEYANGRCREAVAQYVEVARLQKPDHGLLVDWGLAYECAGDPDAAIVKLREAAALDPTAHVYSQIGMVYAKQSRWPEALAALAVAEKRDPYYSVIYYYRGGIRAKTNNFAAAVADYQHALALDPSNEAARQGLQYAQQQLRLKR